MAGPVLFHHPSSLTHDTGPHHPEAHERITAIERALAAQGWLGFERRLSPRATREQLLAVHPASHIDAIGRLAAVGGGAVDPDTVMSEGSWEAALHSAGGAVAMVDALMSGETRIGASLHRPPGHHAEPDRAMGFCLFNNIAVAARRARDEHGVRRVLIVDWDVHHGNGTQAAFYDTDEVLFCSIHQSPLYPGTGHASETGSGPGRGYTMNIPVSPGADDKLFCSAVAHLVVPLAYRYRPELVLISAGYDAHVDDPLASCQVTERGYATMAASLRALADDLEVPVGMVLEGGYDLTALAASVVATLEVLGRRDQVLPPAVEVHELLQR